MTGVGDELGDVEGDEGGVVVVVGTEAAEPRNGKRDARQTFRCGSGAMIVRCVLLSFSVHTE